MERALVSGCPEDADGLTGAAASAVGPEPEGWQSHGVAPRRIVAVDAIRGAALVGMAAYHLAWDLHAFGLTATDPGRALAWRLLGHGVAGAFLLLSGFGLGLARSRGATLADATRRLLVIAAAALLVTGATWLVVPGAFVSFGILHCIVVTNLVALALERLPTPALCLIAVAAMAAPALGPMPGAWPWTGLAGQEPSTLDFRPVLPWLGPVLLGVVAARTRVVARLGILPRQSFAITALAWAGRHSLAIYLIHQPVLVAVLLIATGHGASEAKVGDELRTPQQASAFVQACRAACVKHGGDESVCTATCHCVLTGTIAQIGPGARSPLAQWFLPTSPLGNAIAACRLDGAGSR